MLGRSSFDAAAEIIEVTPDYINILKCRRDIQRFPRRFGRARQSIEGRDPIGHPIWHRDFCDDQAMPTHCDSGDVRRRSVLARQATRAQRDASEVRPHRLAGRRNSAASMCG